MGTSKKPLSVKKNTSKKLNINDLGVYVNLLTDFGFKRIFGKKDLMLHFLNSVLDIKGGIVDLNYDNTEKKGITQKDRTAIYDLYCTTGNGERIIVEMQTIPQEYYKDRTLYYASHLIMEQNEKGKEWDFRLAPVYSVNIVNFYLDEEKDKSDDKYISYIELIDRDTKERFYEKFTFVFIELPRFSKELNELKNFIEQWIYVISNISQLDHLPEELRNEIFEKLFEEAKIAKMNKKEIKKYYQSLKNLSDMNIAKNELAAKDRIIAEKEIIFAKVIAQKDNTIAAMKREIAELRQKSGLNSNNNNFGIILN